MKEIISSVATSVILSKNAQKSKKDIADLAFEIIQNHIKPIPQIIGLEFGGSYAKDTWLSKNADIDIFLRFKESTSAKEFEDISVRVGLDAFKKYSPYIKYSDHPYVEVKIKNTKINIVPFYNVKINKWKSAADRSTFHTELMKKSLTPKMKRDVRILKTFLQANNIYGAEMAKQGFSGYVSEVLILNFKSFEKLVYGISEIKENHTIGKTSKQFDTLISIIDPIDSNRNLGAAVSNENLGRFILICRAFRKNPALKFFKKQKQKPKTKYQKNLLLVSFNFKKRSPDTIWGQIKKTTSALVKQLELGGFVVLKSKPFTSQKNTIHLIFFLQSIDIAEIFAKEGPAFFRKASADSFLAKNLKNTEMLWIKDKHITSLEKRKHTNAVIFMRKFLEKNLRGVVVQGLLADFERGFTVSVIDKKSSKSIKEAAGELISTDGSLLYFN